MEADNTPRMPNMDEVDRKNVHQDGTSQQDVKTLGIAMQVQPSGVIVMPMTTADHLSSKNHFLFLHLPAEVRNMVYQYGTTYVSEADELSRAHKGLPSLRQPPITQVNRQIRQECLHIFYNMFPFSFDLNVRSEEDTGLMASLIPASEDQVSLQSLQGTIQAFAPTPKNMLQMSNLRFLSSLTINITFQRDDEDIGCLGFHMTSADETDFASLDVRGLDWGCRDAVRTAWVVTTWGASFGAKGEDNGLGYFVLRALVEEIMSLLCLIAEHCPQLTRSVSLIYEGPGLFGNDLFDLASDTVGIDCLLGDFNWDDMDGAGDTET